MQDDDAPEDHVRIALNSRFAAGDVDKATELLILQRLSLEGQIVPCSSKIQMVGAENRGAVTCYLDSLLFAMFAKLPAFECMLKDNPEHDKPKRNLAYLLRLWVNMLRAGKLIHIDMVRALTALRPLTAPRPPFTAPRPLTVLRRCSGRVANFQCRLRKSKKPLPNAGGRTPRSSSSKTRPKPSLSSPRHYSCRSWLYRWICFTRAKGTKTITKLCTNAF